MKISSAFKGLAVSAALWSVPANAVTTIYTDQAAFLAALNGPVALEDFDETPLNPTIASTVGNVQGNKFQDRLVRNGAMTTFTFASPVNGFGGIFDLSPGGGLGQGIDFAVNGGLSFVGTIPLINGNRFWGFVTDTSFSDVRLTGGSGSGVAETYHLDNLRFGTLAAGVPEPSVWAFMILGFGAIGAAMRRRRNTRINLKARFAV